MNRRTFPRAQALSSAFTRCGRRVALVLALAGVAPAVTGCATLGRETCNTNQVGFGETPAHEDTKVVQRLLIALSTRDFDSFTAMQPSQSQYLAVSWRHGSTRADAIATVVQQPGHARRDFADLVEHFDRSGLEPRRAERCTRRMTVNGETAHPLYALSVDFGPFAMAIPVYRSPDRTSLAGQPVIEDPTLIDTMAKAVTLQVSLMKTLEKARIETEAMLLLNDFLKDHAKDIETIRERVAVTSWQKVEATALSKLLTPFHADYGQRWQTLQRRFPVLFETPDFRSFAETFYPDQSNEPTTPPVRPPSDPDNVLP